MVAARILSLQEAGEDDKSFSERVGLTPQLVSNWKAGSSGASLKTVAAVLEHVDDLSGSWLVTGEKPVFLREASEAEAHAIQEADGYEVRLKVIGRDAAGELDVMLPVLADAPSEEEVERRLAPLRDAVKRLHGPPERPREESDGAPNARQRGRGGPRSA